MQSDKEKSLSIAYNDQTGTAQRAQRTRNSSIQRLAASSQLARLETAYLRWGTQRFRLAPLESLRRWPHE